MRQRRAARLADQKVEEQSGGASEMVEEAQYSIRDSEGNELTLSQQELEDNKKPSAG